EIWIAKVRHPIERIKGRMIDAVVAAKTHVGRSDSEVLKERREIRSGTKRPNVRFGVVVRISFAALFARAILPLLIDRLAGLGILHLARRGTDQFPKRWHGRSVVIRPVDGDVDVEIRDSLLL